MILSSCELREKDVINVCDGRKLGFICDFTVDTECGKLCSVDVSDRFFSFSGQKNAYRIGWDKIVCIGEDAVLVNVGTDFRCDSCGREEKSRRKGGFLFG